MSESIPIPKRPNSGHESPDSSPGHSPLGKSLPARAHRSFHDPSTRHRDPSPMSSQDDLATISWPPRPSVELVSRAAKKFAAHRDDLSTHRPKRRTTRFDPWDFSEVVSATAEVRTAFQRGSARAERPPREGVSGTYFIRRNESNADVLCVFKPVDEEAADIEMSPPSVPIGHAFGPSSISGEGEFTLGPAHGPSSPIAHSPPSMGLAFHRTGSLSSESDFDSRSNRAPGFHAGEGAYKEVAAYLLDHERFARVPQTALATCNFTSEVPEKNTETSGSPGPSFVTESGEELSDSDGDLGVGYEASVKGNASHLRTKMGAFQVYCENVGDADDFGPGVFDKDQVHRIAVLDIRTLNHDRHGGNILVRKSSSPNRRFDLVPIDHGYILPERVLSIPWPVWMDWPMAREPLSEYEKNYIELLDPDSEAHILQEELDGKLRTGSLQGLKVATKLLQKGVAAGLTLYDIGLLMYDRRDDPGAKSELAKIMTEAEEAGNARERDFAEQPLRFNPGMPKDPHHRRHQSMSSINTHEAYIDDYIVRYATRRIQEVVTRAAAMKEKEAMSSSSRPGGQPRLTRARSIPDFGIGIKPLHALMSKPGLCEVPVNTPVSSPVSDASRSVDANESLEAQLPPVTQGPTRQAPIQIPINDGNIRRIAIPEPRASSAAEPGPFSDHAVARVMGDSRRGRPSPGGLATGKLPPLFKSAARKSSPVTVDMLSWETGSS